MGGTKLLRGRGVGKPCNIPCLQAHRERIVSDRVQSDKLNTSVPEHVNIEPNFEDMTPNLKCMK